MTSVSSFWMLTFFNPPLAPLRKSSSATELKGKQDFPQKSNSSWFDIWVYRWEFSLGGLWEWKLFWVEEIFELSNYLDLILFLCKIRLCASQVLRFTNFVNLYVWLPRILPSTCRQLRVYFVLMKKKKVNYWDDLRPHN